MKFSTLLSFFLSAITAKANLLGLVGTQVVEACPEENLNVVVTKCVENEVLLKNSKKIFYFNPPNEGEEEICDRTINVDPTDLDECAPVQLFDEPAITTITSFSNEKFNISPFIDITCSLDKETGKEVKDCKSWKINENNLTVGDITTTDKSLVGKTVKASVTLNIKPDEISKDKIVVFSYNGENGFQFSINNKNILTMSATEFDVEKTYGYASLLNNNSTTLTWSFMSKLKMDGDDDDKVYAIIDGIAIQGASVLSVKDAKKVAEIKKDAATKANKTDDKEKPTNTDKVKVTSASSEEEKTTGSDKKEKESATNKEEKTTSGDIKEKETVTNKEEKSTSTNNKEKETSTDKKEKSTSTDKKEKETSTNKEDKITPTSSSSSSASNKDDKITNFYSDSEEATSSIPDMEKETDVASETYTEFLENPTATIEKSTYASSSSSTSSKKTKSTKTSEKETVIDKEEKTTATDKEEKVTATDKEEKATATDKEEKATATNKEEKPTATDKKIKETSSVTEENEEKKTDNVEEENETALATEDKETDIATKDKETDITEEQEIDGDDIKDTEEDADEESSGHTGMILVSAGAVTALFFYIRSKKPRFSAVPDAMRQIDERPENERFDYFAEEGFLDDYDEVDEMYDDEIGINVEDGNDMEDDNDNYTNQNLI